MKEFSVTTKEKFRQIDWIVLISVLGMNILSIITLAGCSNELGTRYVLVQTIASVLGIAVMLVFAYIDYDKVLQTCGIWLYVAAVLFMIITVIFGKGENGNKNWLRFSFLPFDIQPSEYVKLLFILTFSRHIKLVKEKINKIYNVLALGVHAGIIIGLVLMTGDLGSALVYMFIMACMLLAGGLSGWYFVGVIALITLSSPLWWNLLSTKRQLRIIYGFYPEGDPLYIGYQALKSRAAIAAGGFLGSGFSGGTAYTSLPACFSDFIFSVVAEKFGFLGCFTYIALANTLIIRLLIIARKARKDYGAYICVGVAGVMIAQVLENIGMCLAMLPVVGITLPFLSYGGSSILAMYMLIGVVQSIKTHNQKYFFEREKA